MSRKLKVYISGPIYTGDYKENVQAHLDAFNVLEEAGAEVINPGLAEYEAGDEYSTYWLNLALSDYAVPDPDFVVRLPGRSSGADDEIDYALSQGIRVYICKPELDGMGLKFGDHKHANNRDDSFDRKPGEELIHWLYDDSSSRAGSAVKWLAQHITDGKIQHLMKPGPEQEKAREPEPNARQRRPKVYVAGPISKGVAQENLNQFVEAHKDLMQAGAAVLNPGLTMCLPGHEEFSHDEWMEVCLPWVEQADFLVRLPGESKGADEEVLHALQHGVRVYIGTTELWGLGMSENEHRHANLTMSDNPFNRQPGQDLIHWLYNDPGHACNKTDALKFLVQHIECGFIDHLWPKPCLQPQCSKDTCVPTCEQCVDTSDDDDQAILAAIKEARGKVYGEPKQNHEGIAMMWAPLLEPWWEAIRHQQPLPPHVVALMMVALKLDRMRLVYHRDNYDDLRNYLGFAQEWQQELVEGGAQ